LVRSLKLAEADNFRKLALEKMQTIRRGKNRATLASIRAVVGKDDLYSSEIQKVQELLPMIMTVSAAEYALNRSIISEGE
jgi:hypothetical protein